MGAANFSVRDLSRVLKMYPGDEVERGFNTST